MFNRNTFLHHTTNTTNHNKMTNAGVKAPFSIMVNESSGYPGSGRRARNTPKDRLRKAVAKEYNIPLEEVPEHTSHKQFVDDTHERHGKTIGDKDDFMNFVVDTLDAYSYDS